MSNKFIIKHGAIINGQAYTPTYDVSTGYTSTTINIDFDNSSVQVITLSGGTTMTLANPTNINNGGTYMLIVKQPVAGNGVLNYGSNYLWETSSQPTITITSEAIDILSFLCIDQGGTSKLVGTYSQNFG